MSSENYIPLSMYNIRVFDERFWLNIAFSLEVMSELSTLIIFYGS